MPAVSNDETASALRARPDGRGAAMLEMTGLLFPADDGSDR